MSASRKMPCNTSRRTSTRASTNPSSRATSSSTTYAPLRMRAPAAWSNTCAVEWLRRAPPYVDCAEPRHITRLLLHLGKCYIARDLYSGFGGTGESPTSRRYHEPQEADIVHRHPHGSTTASRRACGCEDPFIATPRLSLTKLPQVLHHGQRRRKASASHWHLESPRRAVRVCHMKAQSANTARLIRDSHGIDSLNCTLASLLETAALGYGSTKIGAFTALIPVLPMFFSTWETYHTHTLYLGYFNGPTGESLPIHNGDQI
jgi:hypothetical protein